MGYVFDALNRRNDDEKRRPNEEVKPQKDSAPAFEPPAPESPSNEPFIEQDAEVNDAPLAFDTSIKDVGNAFEGGDQNIVASIDQRPESDRKADDRMVVLLSPGSIMAEEYRSIRTGILARWQQKRNLVHTITSATPQEGKTITSLNLGLSFSELRNRRTLVIESDLRLPQFGKLLDLKDGAGLVNVLRGEADIEDTIQRIDEIGLDVIPAGTRAQNDAVQLLSSNRMSQLLNQFRQRYDHVIVDTPPVVELADAGILGAQSDDVLLIVRMERTPRALVEQAIRTLESYNAPVAGMIATDQKRHLRRYYYYRYGYRYQYSYYQRYHKQAA